MREQARDRPLEEDLAEEADSTGAALPAVVVAALTAQVAAEAAVDRTAAVVAVRAAADPAIASGSKRRKPP
jgi:hypothetical protein